MATYFNSSNNQRDAESTLYSREPPGSYSEAPLLPGNNTMYYTNFASSSGIRSNGMAGIVQLHPNSGNFSQMGASDSAPAEQEILSNIASSKIGVPDWRDGGNTMLLVHPVGGQSSMIHGGRNLHGQALSLSLGTQIPSSIQISSVEYQNQNLGFSFLGPNSSTSFDGSGGKGSSGDDESYHREGMRSADYSLHAEREDLAKADSSRYVMSSTGRIIPNSKYLKAAQQLLDEVVNVGKALKQQNKGDDPKGDSEGQINKKAVHPDGEPSGPAECTSDSVNELSPAARHDLQSKLMKLLTMLDEIDRRYRQYYHQMQIVVSSFDSVAGSGSARPYTALALQTISRHFRCLRDTISSQIRSTRKTLGDQDTSESKGVGITRLRFVDQQLRQQKALQQLGMMQQHTWRPQRGLPESSVSILRAWLFEHFLHPYPKDSEKIMLARQAGLTRSQVSNWFINARVRLWKPMVEEMYKEEAGNAEMDSNSSSGHTTTRATEDDYKPPGDTTEDMQQSATSSSTHAEQLPLNSNSKSRDIPDIEMEAPTAAVLFHNDIHQGALPEYGMLKFGEDQTPGVANGTGFQGMMFQSHGGNNYNSFMEAPIRPDQRPGNLPSPVRPGWKGKDLNSMFLSLARPNTNLSEPGQYPEQPWDMQFP